MKKKPGEADKIESANLMEEASGVFDSCIQCGMHEKRGFSGYSVASLVGIRSLRLSGLEQRKEVLEQ